MEKDYQVFVERLRHVLLAVTGYDEKRIYFKEKDTYPPTAGDRLFLECGLNGETREICGLYVRELYERFRQGTPLEKMAGEVQQEIKRIEEAGYLKKAGDMNNYEKVKNDLFIRLLNYERNKKDLKNAIYKMIGDIAMVLYMKMGEENQCITSAKIKEDVLDHWKKDREQVFRDALLNTYFLSPPRIYCWENLLVNPEYDGENFMDVLKEHKIKKDSLGNCLSTTKRTNGAVAVFLPGVAQRLGELLDSGFYMVFTSIHEVMIHSDKFVGPEELRRVLAETVQEATPEEDFLSLYIYHYDRYTGKYSWQ